MVGSRYLLVYHSFTETMMDFLSETQEECASQNPLIPLRHLRQDVRLKELRQGPIL